MDREKSFWRWLIFGYSFSILLYWGSLKITYDILKPYFEEFYANKPKKRYVDFNQGIDSRLINDENMKKLAEIPVKPVRIAFNHWSLHEKYEEAVRTAERWMKERRIG